MWMSILTFLALIGALFLVKEGLKVLADFVHSSGLKKVNISAEFSGNEEPPKQLNK